jgi:acyl dehydratase
MRDPAPLHWDDEEVRRAGLGDRAFNPGIINAAYVVQMVGSWAGGYERVRKVSIRFDGRLFAGDRAVVTGEVEDGVASVRLERETPDGREPVITGEVSVREE